MTTVYVPYAHDLLELTGIHGPRCLGDEVRESVTIAEESLENRHDKLRAFAGMGLASKQDPHKSTSL